MEHMKLDRLGRPHVQHLCISILGEAGGQAPLVDHLFRETEGNVLFLVEVLLHPFAWRHTDGCSSVRER